MGNGVEQTFIFTEEFGGVLYTATVVKHPDDSFDYVIRDPDNKIVNLSTPAKAKVEARIAAALSLFNN